MEENEKPILRAFLNLDWQPRLRYCKKMTFQIESFPNGTSSLKHLQIGESMHSSIGPWVEAQQLYIEQAQLKVRLSIPNREPLVIFDIGLGLAANALASLQVFLSASFERELHLFSFETDLQSLQFALDHSQHFPFLHDQKLMLDTLLAERSFVGNGFQWHLKEGPFQEHVLKCPSPELIYYDLYSPKVSPQAWDISCFKSLYQSTQLRREKQLDTLLITYSAAGFVRRAISAAGFQVGIGVGTSQKRETTLAFINKRSL